MSEVSLKFITSVSPFTTRMPSPTITLHLPQFPCKPSLKHAMTLSGDKFSSTKFAVLPEFTHTLLSF
jgi:hypothetical protein